MAMSLMNKLTRAFGVQDMTVGRPMDTLITFSVPLLIGNFAQQLYNTVDSIIVGQYIGDTALAAVGTSGPILNLMLVLFMGIATGASILSAQFFGAKDRPTLSKLVGSTFFLTLFSGILMSVIGFFASGFLIGLVHPPENVGTGAVIYLQIIFIGMLGAAAYNILSGVLRGMGDSVYPLIFLVIACLLNIFLDILFVRSFHMGIAGVAWATIIAQAISGILCLIRLLRMSDTITCLRDGVYIDTVKSSEIDEDGLKKLMVGREVTGDYYRSDYGEKVSDEVVLSVENVTVPGQIHDVSFKLHKGEILGFGGLSESGMHLRRAKVRLKMFIGKREK